MNQNPVLEDTGVESKTIPQTTSKNKKTLFSVERSLKFVEAKINFIMQNLPIKKDEEESLLDSWNKRGRGNKKNE